MTSAKIGLAVGVILLAAGGAFYWLKGRAAPETAKSFTHMHCPQCQTELSYDPTRVGKTCPQCGIEGPKLVPTVGSLKDQDLTGGLAGKIGNIIAALVIAGAVIELSIYGWILYSRSRQKAREEAQKKTLVCRCPFCDRKIGFFAKMAGTTTVCTRCKTAFALPDAALAEEKS